MSYKEAYYPESKFGGFSDIDGTIAFYLRAKALIVSSSVVVDFGCGRGALADDPIQLRRELRNFKGKALCVIGLDTDEAGRQNPYLDEFRLLTNECWPVEDESIDLVICDSVLEHLPDPPAFFSEASRVLKQGTYLCIRTPNQWGYPALFSRLIPNKDHTRMLAKVKDRVVEKDIFPTLYRCNTIPAIRKQMRQTGFDAVVYGFAAEPSYLSFSRVAYALGVLHQRVAPGFLRPVIFAFGRKVSQAT